MALPCYLAMTAAEIGVSRPFPPHLAWMACHFSPYGTDLSNLPRTLPPGAMVILNDRTPISNHDPQRIASQLSQLVDHLQCSCVLLDFQRPGVERAADVAKALTDLLPCPVGVSELYAEGLNCPVFLPPCPHHTPLDAYITPWLGRELWLEAALDTEIIEITADGSHFTAIPAVLPSDLGHAENDLHIHYRIEQSEDSFRFTLWRSATDLAELLKKAHSLGITQAVGLYQELGSKNLPA